MRKSIIKNKRGEGDILSEETVKLIISVVSISILLLLAGSLFYMFIKSTDIKKADATLEEIIRISDTLKDGQVGRVIISNPRGWYLLGIEDKLCICENDVSVPCDDGKAGVCRDVENAEVSLTFFYPYYLEGIHINDVIELVIVKSEDKSIFVRAKYEDFIIARDFLDDKFIFTEGEFAMKDYILNYVNSKKMVPIFIGNANIREEYKLDIRDDEVEKQIFNHFQRYFKDSDIKAVQVVVNTFGATSTLFSSGFGYSNFFNIKLGEHNTEERSGHVISGDIYVRFSK